VDEQSDEDRTERRRRHPGRRSGDTYAAQVAAHAEGDIPLIPSTWTRKRAIELLTLITLGVGVWAAFATCVTTKIVTRQEVTTRIDSVKTDVKALRGSTEVRLNRVEARQEEAEMTHRLIPAMARTQCIILDRDQSPSIAQASGLPCDSLLRRVPR